MNIKNSGFRQNIRDSLRHLGELRDGLLVGVTVVYILGYVVWSFTALRNGLGLIPALDSQYFFAGIFPAVSLMLMFFLIRVSRALLRTVSLTLGPDKKGGLRLLRRLVIFLGIISLLSLVVSVTWDYEEIKMTFMSDELYLIVLTTSMIGLSLALSLILPADINESAPRNWFARNFLTVFSNRPLLYRLFRWLYTHVLLYSVVIAVFMAGIIAYVQVLYPNLPQAFGGPQVRLAYLDLNASQLSSQSLNDLTGPGRSSSSVKIVRSKELEILFVGSTYIFVRPVRQKGDTNVTLYELPRSAAFAIQWMPVSDR